MSSLTFYSMMSYPLPVRSEFFQYQETYTGLHRPVQDFWSWLHPPSEQMKAYIAYIKKRQWIRRHIPGVQQVYVANSMSFNALHEDSNIDLFIVTTEKKLWITKLFVDSILRIIHTCSRQKTRKQRFDVDFLVDEDMQDLSRLLLTPSDPYLVYWLAHLVPIYHSDFRSYDVLYEQNNWLVYYLPNFPLRQTIFLGIDVLIGVSWIKKGGERCMKSIVGDMVEMVVKRIYQLIFRYKTWKTPAFALRLVCGKSIYKVYDDKRRRYALQRELFKRTDRIAVEIIKD